MKNHNRITRADVNFLESAVHAEALRISRLKANPEPHHQGKDFTHLDKYVDRMRASLEKVRRVARLQLAADQDRRNLAPRKAKVAFAMRELP